MKVDLNKARITEKKGRVITYNEVKEFNKLYPGYNFKKTDLIKIMRAFNSNIAKETMVNVYGVILPYNIGALFINNAGRPKHKPIDYASSKKAGCLVYHKNWETDNNLMRIVYMNKTIRTMVKNTTVMSFNPLQSFKKDASSYFKKNWSKCLKVNYNSTVDIKI
jgi:hypothetical protein